LSSRSIPEPGKPFYQEFGEDAERIHQGYRYHLTDRSNVVHYLMPATRSPVATGTWLVDVPTPAELQAELDRLVVTDLS
jgi:hypothetical protein